MVLEEIADCGNIGSTAVGETACAECRFIHINKESGCEEKNKIVLEEMTLAKQTNFTLKDLSEPFPSIENAKDEMYAYSNLRLLAALFTIVER